MAALPDSPPATVLPTIPIGWVGVGKMGAPMARNLLAAGANLTVSDTDDRLLSDFSNRGAGVAESLSDLKDRKIVFTTLPNDDIVEQVVLGRGTSLGLASILAPGSIVIEMSTISPAASLKIGAALKNAHIQYLRSPISGSTTLAENATLTILASGNAGAWELAQPFLTTMSARQFYLGSEDEARYMKLVLNTLVGASSVLLAEALALGASGGLSNKSMMDVICESAVASPLFKYKRENVVSDDYSPAFTVDQMIKDFTLISNAGRTNGVPMMTSGLILELYRAAANSGLRDDDFFALVKWQSEISQR